MSSSYLKYSPHLKKKAQELRKNMTWSEIKLWHRLNNKQFPYRFIRQKPIDKFIVDFFSPDLMLSIELDGGSHIEEKYKYDLKRQEKLESLGVRFLRFSEEDIRLKIEDVITSIEYWIEENIK
ncbi:DUF559 domain-containing protein [Candidatus Dojkabacteria bacterium]|uniref:DUF559 domain-containing protein n=1 Tax=Candidatus Dojkabacteria bacterium TaxID=2099670 RepID=A0A955L2U2_9BACT|nr:DUF559 domain-containing protein [Candidatus Dojkabacteria bacterium]